MSRGLAITEWSRVDLAAALTESTRLDLTIAETAAVLECLPAEVLAAVRQGRLRDVGVGRRTRFDPGELAATVIGRMSRGEQGPIAAYALAELLRGQLDLPSTRNRVSEPTSLVDFVGYIDHRRSLPSHASSAVRSSA